MSSKSAQSERSTAYANASSSKLRGKRPSDETRNAKDDALDELAFERFYRGVRGFTCDVRQLEAEFIALVGGRLGLRAGEIAHFRSSWVDWRERSIEIPRHQECTKGRDGDELCGYCKEQFQQMLTVHDDLTWDDASAVMWSPKTDASPRSVPFGFSARVEHVVDAFTSRFRGYQHSRTSVNRRVDRTAAHAEGLEPADVYPHALRASAGCYHAARGVEAAPLKSMMGWADISVANDYIELSGRATSNAVIASHYS